MDTIKQIEGKARLDYLPLDTIFDAAKAAEYGAKKYEPMSWKRVDAKEYLYASLRHLIKFSNGELQDDESGLCHLDHVLCNIMFMKHNLKTKQLESEIVSSNKEESEYFKNLDELTKISQDQGLYEEPSIFEQELGKDLDKAAVKLALKNGLSRGERAWPENFYLLGDVWIKHTGSEMPEGLADKFVYVKFRNGTVSPDCRQGQNWDWTDMLVGDYYITHYRIVEGKNDKEESYTLEEIEPPVWIQHDGKEWPEKVKDKKILCLYRNGVMTNLYCRARVFNWDWNDSPWDIMYYTIKPE